jgi:hypothetical protein
MSHRTQITLEDQQYERLLAEASRTGLGLAELVRRAVDFVYPTAATVQLKLDALDESFGAWVEDDDADGGDRAAYLDSMRPGLGERLADV